MEHMVRVCLAVGTNKDRVRAVFNYFEVDGNFAEAFWKAVMPHPSLFGPTAFFFRGTGCDPDDPRLDTGRREPLTGRAR